MAVRNTVEPAVHGHSLKPDTLSTALDAAQVILGHRFARPELLSEALTHRSATSRGARARLGSNERLEFVGDRVLGLLMAEWLAERYPREHEGELGRRLAHLVSQPVLAGIAAAIHLPAALAIAPGEKRAGVARLATVRADAMEAVIGALYADAGLDVARGFVRRVWEQVMAEQAEPPKDAKTALQEWAQARGLDLPHYEVASRAGPPHAPVFNVEVVVGGRRGSGEAGSKRAAEQLAANDLLQQVQ